MDTVAKLWEGDLADLDGEVYRKVVNLMECVHSLHGNYDENEILHVLNELQGFTLNDMEVIDQLNIDIVDIDDE